MSEHSIESSNTIEDATNCNPQDCEAVNTRQIPVAIENIPNVGMMFDSEDELYDYFQKYAYSIGFGIRRSSEKNSDKKYYSLGCARGGVYVPNMTRVCRVSSKTNCKAKISVIVYGNGKCTISRVFHEHNHDLSPNKSRFHRSHKKMDSYTKRRFELNDYAGIPLNKNFHSLVVEAKGYENLSFGEKDCRNCIAKVRQLRLGLGDAEALSNYFFRMQRRSPNFFYVIDVDDEGRLQNVFWVDVRSRAAYESFGDVVSFDSTYLTNKYSMPFAPFVGVNHHGQSMLFGCALISREDTITYEWLFKSWLECINGRPPKAIITDQCRSMKAVVARVFPESYHRLCLWHIMRKIPEKLNRCSRYKEIKKTLKTLVYESVETQEFDDGWSKMIDEFSLEKNEWLCSLFKERKHWVSIYVKYIFWAGMPTTQRSESMNSFFDEYVNSKTSLRQFVEQYDNALKSKTEKETKADFESLNSLYNLITKFNFERQFHKAYTNAMFKLFQDELRGMLFCNFSLFKTDGTISVFHVTDIVERKHGGSRRVVYSVTYIEDGCDIQCFCRLFQFRGIVCRHMTKVFIEKDVKEIHSSYSLSRWRKDVKHRHYHVINCYDDLKSGEKTKQFDHLCANFYEAVYFATSQEKYEYLINTINLAKERLNDDSSWGVVGRDVNLISEDVHHVSNFSTRLLPPLQVRSKGRPPSKRKKSIVEKVMKKKRKKNVNEGTESTIQDKRNSTTSCEHGTVSLNDNSYKYAFDLNQ